MVTAEDIEMAYQKMLRRYPPEQFPEKSREIRDAHSVLTESSDYWNGFFDINRLDWSFLVPYVCLSALCRRTKSEFQTLV